MLSILFAFWLGVMGGIAVMCLVAINAELPGDPLAGLVRRRQKGKK